MKVVCETRTESQWNFDSLKKSKESGALEESVTIKNDSYKVENNTAYFK